MKRLVFGALFFASPSLLAETCITIERDELVSSKCFDDAAEARQHLIENELYQVELSDKSNTIVGNKNEMTADDVVNILSALSPDGNFKGTFTYSISEKTKAGVSSEFKTNITVTLGDVKNN